MRFRYQYRTSANEIRTGEVKASSRDAAYSVLKGMGIRPSRVEEAPGFFNKLFGRGKRWIAIVLLASATALLALTVWRFREVSEENAFGPMDRHQVYGDPALMESLEQTGYAALSDDEGDRYLARFAQPGAIVRFEDSAWRTKMSAALRESARGRIRFDENEGREIRELKRIVLGMREELGGYLANGIGTYDTFVKRIEERQKQEIMIYYQAKNELEKERDPAVFDRRNASLRRLGIKTILPPENFFEKKRTAH